MKIAFSPKRWSKSTEKRENAQQCVWTKRALVRRPSDHSWLSDNNIHTINLFECDFLDDDPNNNLSAISLLVRDVKETEAKKMLEDHEPYDLSVAKEILRYINAGGGSDYLKESIEFVQHFDLCLQADAFKEINRIVKLKDQTAEPEICCCCRRKSKD